MTNFHEPNEKLSAPTRYTLAAALFLISLLLRLWMAPTNSSFSFLTFYPAMVISIYLCGIRPGMLVVALSTSFIIFLQIQSGGFTQTGMVAVAAFLISSFLIGLVVRQLQSFANQSRALFINSPTGMIAVDAESGRIVQANNVALNMFGYTTEEILTKTASELTFPDDLAETLQRNDQLAEGQVNHLCFEKRYLKKDGSFFVAQSSVSTLKNADGKVIPSCLKICSKDMHIAKCCMSMISPKILSISMSTENSKS
jgi:PAS domain S-box-containing protein